MNLGKKIPYSKAKHQDLYNQLLQLYNIQKRDSEFWNYLYSLLTQFSPSENSLPVENVDHINHYVKTAFELSDAMNLKHGNVVEFGANQGLLSLTLQVMGHSILCTDLYHGLTSNSINSYKAGTWLRKNFIGLLAEDTFKLHEDNIDNLKVFDTGIDALVMRGTGILSIENNQNVSRTLLHRSFRIFYKKIINLIPKTNKRKEMLVDIVAKNINLMLSLLSSNGLIFAKNENIFSGYDRESRIELLERLKQNLSDQCDLSFKLETAKYVNWGWNEFIVTLICRKL